MKIESKTERLLKAKFFRTAIKESSPPKNKKELQSFLGKVNYIPRFISNFSGRTKVFTPLLKLNKKDKFCWDRENQKAFEEIKIFLVNPSIMMPPTKRRPLKLYVSALKDTVGNLLA